jgi:hypothetical protein
VWPFILDAKRRSRETFLIFMYLIMPPWCSPSWKQLASCRTCDAFGWYCHRAYAAQMLNTRQCVYYTLLSPAVTHLPLLCSYFNSLTFLSSVLTVKSCSRLTWFVPQPAHFCLTKKISFLLYLNIVHQLMKIMLKIQLLGPSPPPPQCSGIHFFSLIQDVKKILCHPLLWFLVHSVSCREVRCHGRGWGGSGPTTWTNQSVAAKCAQWEWQLGHPEWSKCAWLAYYAS